MSRWLCNPWWWRCDTLPFRSHKRPEMVTLSTPRKTPGADGASPVLTSFSKALQHAADERRVQSLSCCSPVKPQAIPLFYRMLADRPQFPTYSSFTSPYSPKYEPPLIALPTARYVPLSG